MNIADKVKLPFGIGGDGATALDGYDWEVSISYSEVPEPDICRLVIPLDEIKAKYDSHIEAILKEQYGMTLEEVPEAVQTLLCGLIHRIIEAHNNETSEGGSSEEEESFYEDVFLEEGLPSASHSDLDEPGRSAQEDDVQYAVYFRGIDLLLDRGEEMLESNNLSGAEDYVANLIGKANEALEKNGRFRSLMRSKTCPFYEILMGLREKSTDEERPDYAAAIEILGMV